MAVGENVWSFCRAKNTGRNNEVAVRRGSTAELLPKIAKFPSVW